MVTGQQNTYSSAMNVKGAGGGGVIFKQVK